MVSSAMTTPESTGAQSASPVISTGLSGYQNATASSSSYHQSWGYTPPSLLFQGSQAADADNGLDYDVKIEPKLTPMHRTPRSPFVPPLTDSHRDSHSYAAISASQYNTHHNQSQDVRSIVTNSASSYNSSTATRNHGLPTTFESSLSNSNSLHHGLNQPSHRPRTSSQVFSSTQDLAAHYGIPQILPPAPRTTPQQRRTPPPPDLDTLRSNYLNMLSQKSTDNTMAVDSTTAANTVSAGDMGMPSNDVQGILDILASPEFQSASSTFNPDDFLTSPMPFDTPGLYDDFTSPLLGDSPFEDYLTTPLISDSNDMFGTGPIESDYANMSLFGGMTEYAGLAIEKPAPAPVAPKLADTEKMYTISPGTPSLDVLDPTSLYPSPRLPSDSSAFPSAFANNRRKSSATGTRKNLTPDALVPLEAPTQPRKYLTPSATSRKEVPAVFTKKRSRSQAFADEEDELAEEPLAPNATEKEQIEWKRRQNTLAARKSRKRKLEHQQQLETENQELAREVEMWKTRALTLTQILASHGVPFTAFEES